jgi:hypothetical protein
MGTKSSDCAWLEGNQQQTEHEQEESMTNISEHDSEEEGESYSGKQCRISLLILRDSISLHYLLGTYGVGIYVEERWPFFHYG